MAIDIRKEFGRFTGENPDVTLSAAIIMKKPGYPVSRSAEEAEEGLEKAKDKWDIQPGQLYGKAGKAVENGQESDPTSAREKDQTNVQEKDQIYFMGDAIRWNEFSKVINTGKYLENQLRDGTANTGQVYRLMDYCRMFREFLKDTSISGLRFLPMLTYDINRNYSAATPAKAEFKKWVLGFRKEIQTNTSLYYLKTSGFYAMTKTRRQSNE